MGKHVEECLWLLDHTFTKYSVNFFIFEPLLKKRVAVVQFCTLFKLGHLFIKEISWMSTSSWRNASLHITLPYKKESSVYRGRTRNAISKLWHGRTELRRHMLDSALYFCFWTILLNKIFKESRKKGKKMFVFLISAQHKRHWAAESCSHLHHLHRI